MPGPSWAQSRLAGCFVLTWSFVVVVLVVFSRAPSLTSSSYPSELAKKSGTLSRKCSTDCPAKFPPAGGLDVSKSSFHCSVLTHFPLPSHVSLLLGMIRPRPRVSSVQVECRPSPSGLSVASRPTLSCSTHRDCANPYMARVVISWEVNRSILSMCMSLSFLHLRYATLWLSKGRHPVHVGMPTACQVMGASLPQSGSLSPLAARPVVLASLPLPA